LGIGTASNNQPSGVTVLPTDSSGQIVTHFHPTPSTSTLMTGIIDSGSNLLFFGDSLSLSIPLWPSDPDPLKDLSFLYCPPSPLHFSAVNTGSSGSPSSSVNFQIIDPRPLLSS